jgi:hypothetical protein
MKAYAGVDVQIHIFLTSKLAGREWSASCPCHFTPGERAPGTHWIGAGLDDVEKGKFLTLPGLELRPFGRPARSQSYTDYTIPSLSLSLSLSLYIYIYIYIYRYT